MLVVAEDFVGRAIIENRKSFDAVDDFLDSAMEFLPVRVSRLPSLALDLFAQSFGYHLGDALLAPTRELAGELLGFRILDVECHGAAPVRFLPSSYISSFFYRQYNPLKNIRYSPRLAR